jgi:hypothetical protein
MGAYDRVNWVEGCACAALEAAISLMTLGGHSQPLSALYLLRQIMLHRDLRGYSKSWRWERLPARWRSGSTTASANTELVRLRGPQPAFARW